MKNYLFPLVLLLHASVAYPDCGCEGDAYIHVSYIERTSGQEKTVFVVGEWWPIFNYPWAYGSFYANRIIEPISTELKFTELLSQGKRYRVVKEGKTAPVKLWQESPEPVKFIAPTGKEINDRNVRRITRVHQLKVGCTVRPFTVKMEQLTKIANKKPAKIRAFQQQYLDGVEQTRYMLDFLYEGNLSTVTVYQKMDGCI